MSQDIDCSCEARFVGRQDELRDLQSSWSTKKMFGIFGMRSVGTSRLAKEFLASVSESLDKVIYIDLEATSDITTMFTNMCARLGIPTGSHSGEPIFWENKMFEELTTNKTKYVFFFDNAEHFLDLESQTRDLIQNLFINLLSLDNVHVILTSTTKFQLASMWRIYHICEVRPLNLSESAELIMSEAKGVDFAEYIDPLVELSEGLPLLILMIASELRDSSGMLTPKDMVEFLATARLKVLSPESYPKTDGVDAPTQATVKHQVLVPKINRHFLNYDPAQQRFNIQGILRECLTTFYVIRNLPEIRRRYCQTFSIVLTDISRRFHSHEYASALSEFAVEQPNLQKLLAEIHHTTQDTYAFFIQMATECTSFIEKYMAGNCEDFYGECKRAASRYGKETDVALVNVAVGSIFTNVKGDLREGLRIYKDALKVLEGTGKSKALATVYQGIGYNLMMQDYYVTALSYLKKSYCISSSSGKDFQALVLQSLNSMGITLVWLGRFEQSEKILLKSLETTKKAHGPFHPGVGVVLNNLGLMYHQKGDAEMAFKYFQEGLRIKKQTKTTHQSLIASLTNVAIQYLNLNKTNKAEQLLNEAHNILYNENVKDAGTISYVNNTLGRMYIKVSNLDKAEEMFTKALEVRAETATGQYTHVQSLVHLMEVALEKGQYRKCIELGNSVETFRNDMITKRPRLPQLQECYGYRKRAYEYLDDSDGANQALENKLLELSRLYDVYRGDRNQTKAKEILAKIRETKLGRDCSA
ncbi:uncharacterized protein LOC127850378 isoform X3 [Dreissena polymorpha]|uniref:uncharacterized protein LOC127850378 isoform X3 n=1 Tax=Dreissena polymorpha TaxID=45954 RepID=UPI0022647E34|nr:uncharacterized protein LOC127850378 isoform X3 [Dreissena polymorpha]